MMRKCHSKAQAGKVNNQVFFPVFQCSATFSFFSDFCLQFQRMWGNLNFWREKMYSNFFSIFDFCLHIEK